MKKIILIAVLFATTHVACKKHCDNSQNTSTSNYLIFGHFYGFCAGEKCIEIYKLNQTQLFEDTKDIYPSHTSFYDGNYTLLSQQKYDSSTYLISIFPTDLLNESTNVIGQPDAGDGGGLYIEYNFNGIRKFWLIDQVKNNVPTKYHSFMEEVNKRIDENG
jgi:hypothetical protein